MQLLSFLLVIVTVCVMLWLLNAYTPINRKVKNILNIAVVAGLIFCILELFNM